MITPVVEHGGLTGELNVGETLRRSRPSGRPNAEPSAQLGRVAGQR